MTTIIIAIDTAGQGTSQLSSAITVECDAKWVAGYKLAAMQVLGSQVVLVFQPRQV